MGDRDLTADVVARLEATPDPRLREIMTALVRHLHAFTTEVRLPMQEPLDLKPQPMMYDQ